MVEQQLSSHEPLDEEARWEQTRRRLQGRVVQIFVDNLRAGRYGPTEDPSIFLARHGVDYNQVLQDLIRILPGESDPNTPTS